MDEKKALFLLAIADIVLKHGVPAVVSTIKTWQTQTDEPTVEEIRALKVPRDPEEYFKDTD